MQCTYARAALLLDSNLIDRLESADILSYDPGLTQTELASKLGNIIRSSHGWKAGSVEWMW